MKHTISTVAGFVIAGLAMSSAGAGSFDGVFRPDYPFADSWSCSEAFMGQDGGSVGINDGYLYGVENTCELTQEQPVSGQNAVQYRAVCSAEGSEYIENIIIARTDNGVSITRNGHTAYWKTCADRFGASNGLNNGNGQSNINEPKVIGESFEHVIVVGNVSIPIGGYYIVNLKQRVGNYTLVQLTTGGSACPAEYAWLDTSSSVRLSDIFGTCSDLVEVTTSGNTITVSMPDYSGGQRKYVYDGTSIIEMR